MSLRNITRPDPQRTVSGEEHGLIKVTVNSVPFNEYKRFKEKDRPAMEKLHKEQSKMIKARYINRKNRNERLEMTYCLWDGDPLLQYKFIPDEEYEIPKGLVEMINNKKKMERSKHDILDASGRPMEKDKQVPGDDMFIPTGFAA